VYLDIVRLISECRIIDWATFGWAPLAARSVPVVCLKLWKQI
jgi:hypothetical protein